MSELFIERTRTALEELMGRRLDDVRLAVMMLDGMEIADRTHVVALGISTDGREDPARALARKHGERHPRARSCCLTWSSGVWIPSRPSCSSSTAGKAIRRAIKDVFGERALVHRCHRHKERNVCDLLPERDRPMIFCRNRGAWALSDPHLAKQRLEQLVPSSTAPGPTPAARCARGWTTR